MRIYLRRVGLRSSCRSRYRCPQGQARQTQGVAQVDIGRGHQANRRCSGPGRFHAQPGHRLGRREGTLEEDPGHEAEGTDPDPGRPTARAGEEARRPPDRDRRGQSARLPRAAPVR